MVEYELRRRIFESFNPYKWKKDKVLLNNFFFSKNMYINGKLKAVRRYPYLRLQYGILL